MTNDITTRNENRFQKCNRNFWNPDSADDTKSAVKPFLKKAEFFDKGIEQDRGVSQEWFTSEEAAAYLRISVGCLHNKVCNGTIRAYKLGRSNRFLKSELRDLLLNSKKGGF